MRSYKVRIPLLQKIGRRLGREDPIRYDRLTEFQSPFHRIPIPWLRRACDAAYGAMQHRSSDDSFSPEAMRRLRTYYDQPNRRLKALYGIDYLSAVPNRRIRANERPDAGVAAAIPGA
jgi:hypothetical protein